MTISRNCFELERQYVYPIIVMFLPLPFFWALFDMQGSRWTISATQMNGWQGGDKFKMRPDQIQILNPIMILLFLPLFSKVIQNHNFLGLNSNFQDCLSAYWKMWYPNDCIEKNVCWSNHYCSILCCLWICSNGNRWQNNTYSRLWQWGSVSSMFHTKPYIRLNQDLPWYITWWKLS